MTNGKSACVQESSTAPSPKTGSWGIATALSVHRTLWCLTPLHCFARDWPLVGVHRWIRRNDSAGASTDSREVTGCLPSCGSRPIQRTSCAGYEFTATASPCFEDLMVEDSRYTLLQSEIMPNIRTPGSAPSQTMKPFEIEHSGDLSVRLSSTSAATDRSCRPNPEFRRRGSIRW